MCLNHPESTLATALLHGKIIFHETSPRAYKSLGAIALYQLVQMRALSKMLTLKLPSHQAGGGRDSRAWVLAHHTGSAFTTNGCQKALNFSAPLTVYL